MENKKKIKKIFRELAGIAYERELTPLLKELSKKFDEWKENRLSCFELDNLIHQYHNKNVRDLYKRYSGTLSPEIIVVFAVANGILQITEIPEDLRDDVMKKGSVLIAR